MGLTAISIYAPGDIITSAWANILRTNFGVLDSRTGGDPGASSLVAISNGATSSIWTVGLTAVLAMLGYTPVNKAGDTMSGDLNNPSNAVSAKSVAAGVGGMASGGPIATTDLVATGLVSAGTFSGGTTAAGAVSASSLVAGAGGIASAGAIAGGIASFTSSLAALSAAITNAITAATLTLTGLCKARSFESTIDTGSGPPFVVASTANVTNLHVDHAVAADSATLATEATFADAIVDGAVSATAKIADGVITNAKMVAGTLTDVSVAAANKDGVAGTASLRTIGTGATQAAAGNHTHTANAVVASGSYTGNGSTHTDTSLSFQPKRMEFSFSGSGGAVIMASALGFNFSNGVAPIILTGTTFASNGFSTTNFVANGVVYSWTAWG